MKRKILSIALAAMMVIALMVPCFAATVRINGGNDNAKYWGFKLLEAIPDEDNEADGTDGNLFIYSVNDNFRQLLMDVIEGLETQYEQNFGNVNEPLFDGLIIDNNNLEIDRLIILFIRSLPGDAGEPLYDNRLSLPPDLTARKFADAVYAAILEVLTTKDGWELGGTSLVLNADYFEITSGDSITGINDGYWLIVETGEVAGGDGAPIYSLAMLDTAWASDGEITITAKKNTAPTIEKFVKNNNGENYWVKDAVVDLETGTEIEYMLAGSIPQENLDVLIHKNFVYKFVDDLGYDGTQKLTDADSNVRVYIVNKTPPLVENDLTDDNKLVETSYTANMDSNNLEIGILIKEGTSDNVGKPVVITGAETETPVTANSHFIVCYTATITNPETFEPGIDEGAGITNSAYIEYSVDVYNDETGQTAEDTATIYTTQLNITKVAENLTTPLEDAKFVLSNDMADITNFTGTLATFDLNGIITGWQELESSTDLTAAEFHDYIGTGNILTSDEDGKIIIKGLGVGTYYLYEIIAPDGYNLLKNPIVIEVGEYTDGNININVTNGDNNVGINGTLNSGDGEIAFNVINVSGLELPSTGGVGTTIMYIGGTALLIGAGIALAIYFLTDKRRRYADRTK